MGVSRINKKKNVLKAGWCEYNLLATEIDEKTKSEIDMLGFPCLYFREEKGGYSLYLLNSDSITLARKKALALIKNPMQFNMKLRGKFYNFLAEEDN